MRILVVHAFYGSEAPSGENVAVLNELAALKNAGHIVEGFFLNNDSFANSGLILRVTVGLLSVWNPWMQWKMYVKCRKFQPDIVHVHNLFPFLSPAVLWGIPAACKVVLTLHNYRLYCLRGIPLLNGRPCFRCDSSNWFVPGLINRCYRNSSLASGAVWLSMLLHKTLGTYQRKVDKFISLTQFQEKIINRHYSSRLPMIVKPNFTPKDREPLAFHRREPVVTYIGRLSEEKGLGVLLAAWKMWGRSAPRLNICGSGPLFPELRAENRNDSVYFLGNLSHSETMDVLRRSKLVVLPSLWFEGAPMVIGEAFSLGVPVVCSKIGSLPYLVADRVSGVLFDAGDVDDLYITLSELWANDERLSELSAGAQLEFERLFSEKSTISSLEQEYSELMDEPRE